MKKKCNNSNSEIVSRIIRDGGGVTSDRHQTGWVRFAHTAPYRKCGFTLAEVLITLAIVGVVAALTLPNLIADYKKKSDVVKLKKAYTTLQQAWRRSEVDNGPSEHWEDAYTMGSQAYFEKYWKPYFNNPILCNTYQECGFEDDLPYVTLNGLNMDTYVVSPYARSTFYLLDGTMYVIFVSGGSDNAASKTVWIDINGSKKPNILGRDLFYFQRIEEQGLVPSGWDESASNVMKNCSLSDSGKYCARRIMMEGWEMNY